MKRLFLLWMSLFLVVPAFGHDAISKETLKELFPEAENFVNRRKALSAEQIRKVEQSAGEKLQEIDKNLTVFVAVAKDPETNKMKSIGAVLMVDAKGSTGVIDLAVAYDLDGSVKKVLVTENKDDVKLESEAFLGQLKGKSPSDRWDLDKDFQLVANADSARALIRAVRRGMYLFLAFMGQLA
ncbi:hypothetical protein MYX82_09165 [Acidobacteria bacterium AH-259-D05]|nr:hypothetical protein [Acidobacteria bacterium AH-259-D05]